MEEKRMLFMKKKSIILLILGIVILGIHTNVKAAEKVETTDVFTYAETNPLYPEEQSATPTILTTKKKAAVKAASASATATASTEQFKPSEYIENKTTIAKTMRTNMVNRETTFRIKVKLPLTHKLTTGDYETYVGELKDKAVSEELATTSSTGDYLKWSWGNFASKASPEDTVWLVTTTSNGKTTYSYYFTAVFDFTYYTTKEQEETVNKNVKQWVQSNITDTDTDYQKINKVYQYICKNVTYDQENKDNEAYTLKYTAYAALQNKTAVCQGYATLYYKMLKEAGVSGVRIITSATHAWNIVKLGVMYYHVDSTWDAGRSSYLSFLRGSKYFDALSEHTKSAEYTTAKFRKTYPIDSVDYNKSNPKISLGNCTYSNSYASYAYNNKAVTPSIKVTYCDYQLVPGQDYQLTVKNNTAPGIGTIEITGKNHFTGKISNKTFKIVPAKVSGVKASKNTTSKIRVSWSKLKGVTAYKVYQYNTKSKTYEYVKGSQTDKNYVDIKKLSAGNEYRFKVRAFKTSGEGDLYGAYSDVVYTATTPNKVTISKVTKGKKKLTAKWKKVSAGTGYIVEYATSKKFTSKTTKKVTVSSRKTVSKTIKNLKSKKKYYVRIRAYKTVKGKKYYGAYSKVKNVTVK